MEGKGSLAPNLYHRLTPLRRIGIICTSAPKYVVTIVLSHRDKSRPIQILANWWRFSWFLAIFYCACAETVVSQVLDSDNAIEPTGFSHRRIAGGAWGCCSTPKLSEIFRLSEILGCRSEIFITYLYKKRTLYYCENVLIIFRSTYSSVKQCLPV